MSRKEKKSWDRCLIKSIPFVKREVVNKEGRVIRNRGVEEMLSTFKKYVSKSGVLQKAYEKQYFTPKSTRRRDKKKRIQYQIDRQNRLNKEARRKRGDSR